MLSMRLSRDSLQWRGRGLDIYPRTEAHSRGTARGTAARLDGVVLSSLLCQSGSQGSIKLTGRSVEFLPNLVSNTVFYARTSFTLLLMGSMYIL